MKVACAIIIQHAEAIFLFTTGVKSFLFGSVVPHTAHVNDSLYSDRQRIKIYYPSQSQITIKKETLWKFNPLFSKFLYILIHVYYCIGLTSACLLCSY